MFACAFLCLLQCACSLQAEGIQRFNKVELTFVISQGQDQTVHLLFALDVSWDVGLNVYSVVDCSGGCCCHKFCV